MKRPVIHTVINYAKKHWNGQHSLAWSFWVNLVAIRILVFNLQSVIAPDEGQDYNSHAFLLVSGTVIFHGLLLIWQLVGVVRAAEQDFAERGNMALVWATQLGAILMFLLSAVYGLGALQWVNVAPAEEDPLTRMAREHASQYQLSVTDSGNQLTIEGSIESGISRAVRKVLQVQPLVSQVILESPGGNVYEGRALASIFREYQLDTHINGICASACTTAFTGGKHRTAAPDSALGFHQYRLDASYAVIAVDVQKEQEKDAALFRQAGIHTSFVTALFERSPEDMWWPTLDELLSAGMIHQISQ